MAQIKTIPQALGILEKYGRHLLKPRERRAELWRQIKFSNAIFKDRVLPMKVFFKKSVYGLFSFV